MLIKKLLFSILVLQINEVLSKRNCNDCQLLTTCNEAMDLNRFKQDHDTRKLFLNAFCGWETDDDEMRPKVCCSDFQPLFKPPLDLTNDSAARLLPKKCGTILSSRLLGGQRSFPNQYSWTALIAYKTRDGPQFQCGGSVINSKYILTAAHCVLDKEIEGVRVGEYDTTTDRDCDYSPLYSCADHVQDFHVVTLIPHEKYDKSTHLNDIALLRLGGEINFNNTYIEPICLPTSAALRSKDLDKTSGVVAGWGYTERGQEYAVLQHREMHLITNAECSNLFNRYKHDPINQFCAGNLNENSCIGDSGGPIIIENDYNGTYRYVQYGISSFGPVSCGNHFPAVFTDVRKYVDWILDHIRE